MIAVVFFMQSIGQLLATVVALIATARITGCEGVQLEQSTKIDDECLRAVDRTWRFIVGFGAVPALFAIVSRLTIPESPRFTLDVIKNPTIAKSDAKRYGEQLQQSSSTSISSVGGHLSVATQRAQSIEMEEWNGMESLGTGTERSKGSQQLATESKTTKLSARGDIRDYFITKGNYRNLAGTMLSWFFLDFAFFGLGINNSNTLATIWSYRTDHEVDLDMTKVFLGNGIHLLVLVSVGSVIGGATTIALIEKIGPKRLQICGFAILSCLLVIIGASYKALIRDGQRAALIPLYIICHIFFNFGGRYSFKIPNRMCMWLTGVIGPNTTTFIVSDICIYIVQISQ
jgi:PHS family inorganic phosphate transporter-like MFS transporter